MIASSLRPALRDLVRFDRSKITYITAAQNAIGVFIPLAVAAASGNYLAGLALSIGALNVAFSDRPGPYRLRAGRMLLLALLGGLSTIVGGITGSVEWLTVALVALWALSGGILVVFGPAAEQIGLTGIVLLVVYGGFGLSPHDALIQAVLIVLGGIFQTALSVATWPFRTFSPERKALASVFRGLAAYARTPSDRGAPPPATAETTTARTTLSGLGRSRSTAAEAFRVLLDEAERIRLELVALDLLRSRLPEAVSAGTFGNSLEMLWTVTAQILDRIADGISRGTDVADGGELLQEAECALQEMHQDVSGQGNLILIDVLGHADALLGQLRASVDIARSGRAEQQADRSDTGQSARLRLGEPISTLRANLTLRSASFRHALRLAVTLAVATLLARHLGVSRSYWVPLTVAMVLKPDFNSTFTRGVLRVVGTMGGLLLATALIHVVGGDVAARVVLIGFLAFVIRSVGPANFGLSAVAVTALVVFLISFIGASPESIVHLRAVDTLIGGVLSLLAYAVWPSWERARTPLVVADMLEAYRRYFDAVMNAYRERGAVDRDALDRARLEARLARSNAEASADRMQGEPATTAGAIELMQGILASSHRFAGSALGIEASLYAPTEFVRPDGLSTFLDDVDRTLEALSAALRMSSRSGVPDPEYVDDLPSLRADQNAMMRSLESQGKASALLPLETERITNSLNTMVDLVRRASAPAGRGDSRQDEARDLKRPA